MAAAAIDGVPVMAQVEALMLRPAGRAGEIRQPDTIPVVTAVCVADTPTVSTTVVGENDTVGFASTTARFNTALPVPVLLESVMV